MDPMTIFLLLLLAMVMAIGKLQSLFPKKYKNMKTNLPGPKGWPLVGCALAMWNINTSRDAYHALLKISNLYNAPIFSVWMGPGGLIVVVKGAKYLESLLNHRALVAKSYFYSDIKRATKNGVFTRNGEDWERLRKPLMNFTRPKNIENFHEKIKYKVTHLSERFEKKCDKGLFPLTILCKAWANEMFLYSSFNLENFQGEEEQDYLIHQAENVLGKAFVDMFSLKANLGMKTYSEKENEMTFKIATGKFIETRKADLKAQGRDIQEVIKNPENYIDVVMQIGQLDGMPDDQVGFLLVDVIVGALDSPGTVLTTMILFLAIFPEYQEKLYQEQIEYFGDSFRPPEEDELKNLPYLDMVMKEAIRICAPPVVSRKASEDMEVDGYHIPKGCVFVFSVVSTLNDPEHWERPDSFYPDHFLPEAVAKRHKGAFLPFVTGPKMCPGQLYSYQVVRTAMSVIVRQFEFKTQHKYADIDYKILLMREPVDPYVSVTKRL